MAKPDKAGHGSGGKPQAHKAAKAAAKEQEANKAIDRELRRAEDIRVDLGEQDLKFKVCGSCYGFVLPEHWDGHVAWHGRLAARWKKTCE